MKGKLGIVLLGIILAFCTPERHPLKGVWISHHKAGFDLIEIESAERVRIHRYFDPNKLDEDSFNPKSIWYYENYGSLSTDGDGFYTLTTTKYQFKFRLEDEKLVEYDQSGKQGTFVKTKSSEYDK